MALAQHEDADLRFEQQVSNARRDVLPFVAETKPVEPGMRVLEVGCAEGGVLVPFAERGAHCFGVDLEPARIDRGRELVADFAGPGSIDLRCQNVLDREFTDEFAGSLDLVILKDSIEHIPNQEQFVPRLRALLRPGGQIFFGFPPWRMPFGGHQQICHAKLGMLPWYHLLPRRAYRAVLQRLGEPDVVITELMELKETGISTRRFAQIIAASGLTPINTRHFLINPIYRDKFGLKPRTQLRVITRIPELRDFVTTCVYCTVARLEDGRPGGPPTPD